MWPQNSEVIEFIFTYFFWGGGMDGLLKRNLILRLNRKLMFICYILYIAVFLHCSEERQADHGSTRIPPCCDAATYLVVCQVRTRGAK